MKKGKRFVFVFLLFVLLTGTMGCGYRPFRPKNFEIVIHSGDRKVILSGEELSGTLDVVLE